MSASDITPSAFFHPRSPNKTMRGASNPFDDPRSPTQAMPGALNPFDEETKDDPQKLSDAQKIANHQETASINTPYMAKSTQATQAPAWDNFRAALFSWLTLAGYVVFPGTFTSLKASQTLASNSSGRVIQDAVKNIPLLPIAILCCIIGTSGTTWLWWIWRDNAIWLVTHLFLPGLLHSLVGLITTLINIYTAQGGHWSVTAKITVIVIGLCTGNMSVLYLVYNHWILEKMKTSRDRALARRSHP